MVIFNQTGQVVGLQVNTDTLNDPRKFTVVYSRYFQIGSHQNSTVHYDHVETDNILSLLDSEEKYSDNVWFVFHGHAQPVREYLP